MGLVISAVASNGVAERAGLLVGDVLLGVAGKPLRDAASLREALARNVGAGETVRLRVMRGGELREVEVRFEGGAGRAGVRGA
jgi:serine protease Do